MRLGVRIPVKRRLATRRPARGRQEPCNGAQRSQQAVRCGAGVGRAHLKAPTSMGSMSWPGGATPRQRASDTFRKGTPDRSATNTCGARARVSVFVCACACVRVRTGA
jgi:hypothetical protein